MLAVKYYYTLNKGIIMTRLATKPITIPQGVEVSFNNGSVLVKSSKGEFSHQLESFLNVEITDNGLMLECNEKNQKIKKSKMLWGTHYALIKNSIIGLSQGFEKKLQLVGVGYRVKVQGKKINLVLGYSHPINYDLPEGVEAESPSQTELTLKSMNKQLLGQVASEIRAYRPPEPYKGKGVRYADEHIVRKETKKK